MTKKELIAALAEYPDDIEIYVDMFNDDQYETDNIWVSSVRDIHLIKPERRVQEMKIAQRACQHTKDALKCLVI